MFNTIDIVPDSIAGDPQVIAACQSIDAELAAIYAQIPDVCFWPNLDAQSGPMLDVLAWEMHVDIWQGWSGDLPDSTKLDLIKSSIDWHQHKGTKYVVEKMLQLVFTNAYVTEWFQYGGTPYHFRIVVSELITDPTQLAKVLDAITAVKNVRSQFDGFIQSKLSQQHLVIGVSVIKMKSVYIPADTLDLLGI